MSRIFNIDKTYQFLLISLAFLMPLTVFGANLVIVLICVLWLVTGDYTSKFQKIIKSKLMLVSILFFCIHLIGLAWSEDLSWGLHITHKMWYFLLLFPILYTVVAEKNIKYYIYSFLFAISITEVASYLIWFELIAPFKNATIENPTPFMSHISYNPILAFATYLVLHEIFFNRKISNLVFSFYIFFGFSMIVNMFITGGRSGQVIFFIMLIVLIFQVFDKQRIKSLIAICLVIPVVFMTAYKQSELFKERVDLAFFETISYDNQSNNSVGLRLNFAINSIQIIKENLILGVGTGDFPGEYSRINKENSPSLPNTSNPHNMYLLVISQTGIVGLISLLSIFYYQINLSFRSSNKFIRDVGLTLPIMFLVLMFGDSYLLGHYTTLMFVFFSSFLYKDFEKS